MTHTFTQQKNRLIVIILSTLIPFLSIIAYYIYDTQSKQIHLDVEKRVETEIALLSEFVTDSLIRHDYAEARNFLKRWIKTEKNISYLLVTLSNGKELYSYGDFVDRFGDGTFSVESHYSKIVIGYDSSDIDKILDQLKVVLIFSLIFIAGIFALTLWFILSRWILTPFKDEIDKQTNTVKKYSQKLEVINRSYKALSETNIALVESDDEKELLNRVCDIVHSDCRFKLVWIGYRVNDEEKSIKINASCGDNGNYIENLKISWADNDHGRGPAGTSIRDKRSVVLNNTELDKNFSPWRTAALKMGFRSIATFPILHGNEVLGVMTVYSGEVNAFLAEEISLLTELSCNVGFGILALRDRKKVEELSIKDQLTGLYNRRKVDEVLMYELDRSKRYSSSLSLLLVDIDHFKKVNDNFGHSVGDSVLKEFAKILLEDKRSTDFIGRWGGEEFVIILPNTTIENAVLIGERVRKTTEKKEFSTVKKVTVSVGITTYEEEDSLDSLFDKADNALYRAKRGGRNRVEQVTVVQ